jgi:Arc/MetJ-type ribon-helix-helix transcriptional regulator
MVIGMATQKITITLDQDQVREIRELVAAGRAANVSAFIKHAVNVALSDAAGWKEVLDEALRQTGGPLTKEERAWARAILNTPRRKRAGKKHAA